jgi:hypothetical protein
MNICDIIKIENIFEFDFNYQEAKRESENIKYKYSCFFMSIYNKNKVNIGIFTEDEIFKNTLNDFKETLVGIINQDETKEPFFEIKNIDSIMKSIRNPKKMT